MIEKRSEDDKVRDGTLIQKQTWSVERKRIEAAEAEMKKEQRANNKAGAFQQRRGTDALDKFKDYAPTFKLDYTDEFGNQLGPKEVIKFRKRRGIHPVRVGLSANVTQISW